MKTLPTSLIRAGACAVAFVTLSHPSAQAETLPTSRLDPAQRVVTRFYAFYNRENQATPTSWAPVRQLFDPEFLWMLFQYYAPHPAPPQPVKGYECNLDSDPFGLGQAGGSRAVRVNVGPTVERGTVVIVPARLFFENRAPGGPLFVNNVALALRRERGSYRIFDVYDAAGRATPDYRYGLRKELTRIRQDSLCRWPRYRAS